MGINISFGDAVQCVLGIAQFVMMKEQWRSRRRNHLRIRGGKALVDEPANVRSTIYGKPVTTVPHPGQDFIENRHVTTAESASVDETAF